MRSTWSRDGHDIPLIAEHAFVLGSAGLGACSKIGVSVWGSDNSCDIIICNQSNGPISLQMAFWHASLARCTVGRYSNGWKQGGERWKLWTEDQGWE